MSDAVMSPRGSRKRGMFTDGDQDPAAKQARLCNPEFSAAFRTFDRDQSGHIDLSELQNALRTVKWTVETNSTPASFIPRHFNDFNMVTCCWLCARFSGGGSRLDERQFCELLDYLQNLKQIFQLVDVDHSGDIGYDELHRAFRESGVFMDGSTVIQVARSYDTSGQGKLAFDDFVQMRLEWDYYVDAWDQATQGNVTIAPLNLLAILEQIKTSLEPVKVALVSHGGTPVRGLFYSTMFGEHRPFNPKTCERLIIRFGRGSFHLQFEQFCEMLVFLKQVKIAFSTFDTNHVGSLSLAELTNAFLATGMNLPTNLVLQIGQKYDADKSGAIEFDEFVQIAAEWGEMWGLQGHFGVEGRISPAQLQEILGSVRVVYKVVNGTIQTLRPFSLNTCRWLIAKFGQPQQQEAFAQGVTHTEFLHLAHYVKDCHDKFGVFDTRGLGSVSATELRVVMDAYGLHLSVEAVDNIRRSYDMDYSGKIEFDEFLQMLLECQLYEQRFNDRVASSQASTLSPFVHQTLPGTATVTLDKSSFFSLVFAVPRNLG